YANGAAPIRRTKPNPTTKRRRGRRQEALEATVAAWVSFITDLKMTDCPGQAFTLPDQLLIGRWLFAFLHEATIVFQPQFPDGIRIIHELIGQLVDARDDGLRENRACFLDHFPIGAEDLVRH